MNILGYLLGGMAVTSLFIAAVHMLHNLKGSTDPDVMPLLPMSVVAAVLFAVIGVLSLGVAVPNVGIAAGVWFMTTVSAFAGTASAARPAAAADTGVILGSVLLIGVLYATVGVRVWRHGYRSLLVPLDAEPARRA